MPHQLENNPRAIAATQTCINFLLQTTNNITKAATRAAPQVDDAHSADDSVKQHLR